MYRDGTIRKYLDDAAAGIPAPGGGSVSALAGALATTMGSMAANFTVGKKKFSAVEPEAKAVRARLDGLRERLLDLVDEDVAAYTVVAAAYGMPRDTPEQKSARTAKIQEALVVAMDAPLRTMRACAEVLRALEGFAGIANPNLLSDVGVAAVLAEAALRGAKFNVDVNLAALANDERVRRTKAEAETLAAEAARVMAAVVAGVEAQLTS